MPTLTVFPDADPETTTVDGWIRRQVSSGNTWSDIRNGVGTDAYTNDIDFLIAITAHTTTNYFKQINRCIFLFDTSSIGTTATVTGAILSLFGYIRSDSGSWNPNIDIYTSAPASNTDLVTSDYANIGSVSQTGSPKAYSGWSISSYNDFTLNATGLININKTGVSKFGARNANYDVANIAPTWVSNAQSYLGMYGADQSGTTNDPKLVVTYSIPTTRTKTFTINTLIKKKNILKTFTVNSLIKKENILRQFNIDTALKLGTILQTFTIDTAIKKLDIIKEFNIDTFTRFRGTSNFSIDTFLSQSISHTAIGGAICGGTVQVNLSGIATIPVSGGAVAGGVVSYTIYRIPILTDKGAETILKLFFNNISPNGGTNLIMKLFTNNISPNDTDTILSYEEAVGGGYENKTLNTGSWTISGYSPTTITYDTEQEFIFTGQLSGNDTIYGYYVVNLDNELLWVEKFDTEFIPNSNGDKIVFTPLFKLGNGTPI